MKHTPAACPFTAQIKSLSEDNQLQCELLLRHLPGKRLVYKGLWQQRSVLVKVFLDVKHSGRHWAREKAGVEALKEAGIATPELLYSGQLDDDTPILVFDFLPEAVTALDVWETLSSKALRRGFLCQLVELIGKLHTAGLIQQDLHLENFLLSGQQLFAIDGDGIDVRNFGKSLSAGCYTSNLALFFAQLLPEHDQLMEAVVQHYAKQRHIDAVQLLARLKSELPRVRRKRRNKYVKKSYRSCSEFVCMKRPGETILLRRDAHNDTLDRLLDDPDAFLKSGTLLKDGNTSTVARVQVDGHDWVIKRYNLKNPWHFLTRCFRPTRAWTSWGNAHRLKISGIATPRAVAMIEKRFGPLRSTGYFVCDFVAGPRAQVFFQDKTVDDAEKQAAANSFVRLFEQFYKLGIHHGDCKALNFLLSENTPCVLDLDAMHETFSRACFKRLFQVDRARFLLNWQSQPELQQWFDERLPK